MFDLSVWVSQSAQYIFSFGVDEKRICLRCVLLLVHLFGLFFQREFNLQRVSVSLHLFQAAF